MPENRPLLDIYRLLRQAFGHQRWWPADTVEEVVVGAILAQNVAWRNARTAIRALAENRLLSLEAIHHADAACIAPLIRSSRFYNQKAERLKNFSALLFEEFNGRLPELFALETDRLRQRLLELKGFGEETVDSILLYAAEKPVFVIDAYTRRIFSRLGLFPAQRSYRQFQAFFMEALPRDIDLYQDYHAQIVHLGNRVCKKTKPLCTDCPIAEYCVEGY
jgi:endonuclease-3 related protein